MKWFPDKKGLISGLAVAGFGFGATIWVKVAGSWFGLIEKFGVQSVFLWYGIAFTVLVLIGSIWMVDPPKDYKPKGMKEAKKDASSPKNDSEHLGWKEMLGKPNFWLIWLIFIVSGGAGLMVIGTIRLFGIDALATTLGAASISSILTTPNADSIIGIRAIDCSCCDCSFSISVINLLIFSISLADSIFGTTKPSGHTGTIISKSCLKKGVSGAFILTVISQLPKSRFFMAFLTNILAESFSLIVMESSKSNIRESAP
jgi:hypothetical protein